MKPPKETTTSAVQSAWWACQGIVYFFGAGDPPLAVKIGVTALTAKTPTVVEAVRRRHREIQTSNHEPIQLLGVVHLTEGPYPMRSAEVLERELHIQFAAHQRFAMHSRAAEWFNASPEIMDYISASTSSPESLGIPRFLHTR